MHMAQKYGNTIETIKKLRDLPLSEVTSRSYMNMDIEELLGNIEFLENKLEAELNIDVINLLMNLYQKVSLFLRIIVIFLRRLNIFLRLMIQPIPSLWKNYIPY